MHDAPRFTVIGSTHGIVYTPVHWRYDLQFDTHLPRLFVNEVVLLHVLIFTLNLFLYASTTAGPFWHSECLEKEHSVCSLLNSIWKTLSWVLSLVTSTLLLFILRFLFSMRLHCISIPLHCMFGSKNLKRKVILLLCLNDAFSYPAKWLQITVHVAFRVLQSTEVLTSVIPDSFL